MRTVNEIFIEWCDESAPKGKWWLNPRNVSRMFLSFGHYLLEQQNAEQPSKKTKMIPMKFEIRKSDDGQFYYVLIGANGETMLTSETMTTKQNCKNAIDSIYKTFNIKNEAKIIDKTK